MDTPTVISIVAGILAVAAIAFSLWQTYHTTKAPLSKDQLVAAAKKIPALFQEYEAIGIMAVAAAEQLKEAEGQVNINDVRYKAAFDYVNTYFGGSLDPSVVEMIVEGSYNLYKKTFKSTDGLSRLHDIPVVKPSQTIRSI